MKKILCIVLIELCFYNFACTQQTQKDNNKDEVIFDEYIKDIKAKTHNDLFLKTALYFLNTPYGYSTLEVNDEEDLVINLREFDCFTYVENTIALYRTIILDSINFEHFKKELKNVRYKNGIIEGYTSRLHYTTDWIIDNENKKYILDKTYLIGGIELPVNLYFMSKNYEKYKYLKEHPEDVEKIKTIEEKINSKKHYFIPKEQIRTIEKKINSGDILCFTTKIGGLDVSHMGIALWHKDILTFIHASTKYEKIIINSESLFDYCNNSKNITGIIVLELTQAE